MNRRAQWLGTWGAIAALAGAFYWGASWRLKQRRQTAADTLAARERQIARLEAERARLDPERAPSLRPSEFAPVAVAAVMGKSTPQPIAPLPEITEAAVRKEAMLSLAELRSEHRFLLLPGAGPTRALSDAWSLERDGRPSAAFGLLFGLNAGQLEELQRATERVRLRVNELAAAHARARREAGGVVIEIAETREMDGLRVELRTAFEQAIGYDGLAAYDGLRRGGFAALLSSFGLGQRTVTVERRGSRYHVRETTTGNGPDATRNNFWTSDHREGVEARLGPVARLIPPDF